MNEYKVLESSALFAGIEKTNLLAMLKCLSAKSEVFEKDEYVFSAGESVSKIGIVLSGCVDLIKEDYWGNRTILARAGAGELFGEAFSCSGNKIMPLSVVALEKSQILFIDYRKIITTCSSSCEFHTRLISNMLQILAAKNILLMQKMEHITKRGMREKILSYLSEQAVSQKSNNIVLPFNRQELADFLSVDRSAMSKELCKMRDEGILEFQKNHFTLRV